MVTKLMLLTQGLINSDLHEVLKQLLQKLKKIFEQSRTNLFIMKMIAESCVQKSLTTTSNEETFCGNNEAIVLEILEKLDNMLLKY